MQVHHSDLVTYYTGDATNSVQLKYGFFTRSGGISLPPYDSLNMKLMGDEPANVLENRRRACAALGLDGERLVFASLAHKGTVQIVTENEADKTLDHVDALVTQTKDLPMMISIADCVPVVIADQAGTTAGVIHVSWRSLVAGIIENTFAAIEKAFKLNPSQFSAVLGPAIAQEHYEVQADFIEAMSKKLKPEPFLLRRGGKSYFDLPAATRSQLEKLRVAHIEHIPIDTYSHTEVFYSFRKEAQTGRFGAIVALPD